MANRLCYRQKGVAPQIRRFPSVGWLNPWEKRRALFAAADFHPLYGFGPLRKPFVLQTTCLRAGRSAFPDEQRVVPMAAGDFRSKPAPRPSRGLLLCDFAGVGSERRVLRLSDVISGSTRAAGRFTWTDRPAGEGSRWKCKTFTSGEVFCARDGAPAGITSLSADADEELGSPGGFLRAQRCGFAGRASFFRRRSAPASFS